MDGRPVRAGDRSGRRGIVAAVLFLLAYLGARLVLEGRGAPGVRVAAALAPVAPFAWLMVEFIRSVRGGDELERRIQLEALVIAYPLALVLLLALGLLELAVDLAPEDLSYRHVWAMLPTFYFLGLILARRRYA